MALTSTVPVLPLVSHDRLHAQVTEILELFVTHAATKPFASESLHLIANRLKFAVHLWLKLTPGQIEALRKDEAVQLAFADAEIELCRSMQQARSLSKKWSVPWWTRERRNNQWSKLLQGVVAAETRIRTFCAQFLDERGTLGTVDAVHDSPVAPTDSQGLVVLELESPSCSGTAGRPKPTVFGAAAYPIAASEGLHGKFESAEPPSPQTSRIPAAFPPALALPQACLRRSSRAELSPHSPASRRPSSAPGAYGDAFASGSESGNTPDREASRSFFQDAGSGLDEAAATAPVGGGRRGPRLGRVWFRDGADVAPGAVAGGGKLYSSVPVRRKSSLRVREVTVHASENSSGSPGRVDVGCGTDSPVAVVSQTADDAPGQHPACAAAAARDVDPPTAAPARRQLTDGDALTVATSGVTDVQTGLDTKRTSVGSAAGPTGGEGAAAAVVRTCSEVWGPRMMMAGSGAGAGSSGGLSCTETHTRSETVTPRLSALLSTASHVSRPEECVHHLAWDPSGVEQWDALAPFLMPSADMLEDAEWDADGGWALGVGGGRDVLGISVDAAVVQQEFGSVSDGLLRDAAGGEPEACCLVAEALQSRPDHRSRESDIARLLRLSSDADYLPGMLKFAECLELGRGVTRDHCAALEVYKRAAKRGSAEAQFRIGTMVREGRGAGQDSRLAAAWFKYASQNGHVGAAFQLGTLHESGEGVAKDLDAAEDLYSKAIACGYKGARLRMIALLAKAGRLHDAEVQLHRACHERDSTAICMLAAMQDVLLTRGPQRLPGTGVVDELNLLAATPADLPAACEFWKWVAAVQGCAEAQHWAAEKFREAGDLCSALEYYERAGRQRFTPSLMQLGQLAGQGAVVQRDVHGAIEMYKLALEAGETAAGTHMHELQQLVRRQR